VLSAIANMTVHCSSMLTKIESDQATRSLNSYLASLSCAVDVNSLSVEDSQIELASLEE
jgi:hypothetical protein